MTLRHRDGPPPRWLVFCAGPILVIFGLFVISFAVLVQSHASILNAGATIAGCTILIWVGILLTREHTWPGIKQALGRHSDRTGRDG
jgi:hypothetical protein